MAKKKRTYPKRPWNPRGNLYRPRIQPTSRLRIQYVSNATGLAENGVVDLAISLLYEVCKTGGLEQLKSSLPSSVLGNKIIELSAPIKVTLEENPN